jgi:hypothetical protein
VRPALALWALVVVGAALGGCERTQAPPAPPPAVATDAPKPDAPKPDATAADGEKPIDPTTGFVVDTDWELVVGNCTACHSSKLVIQNRGDEAHWIELIRWMQKTQNLWPIDPASEKKIVEYLARNYGAGFLGRRAPIPPELLPPDPTPAG